MEVYMLRIGRGSTHHERDAMEAWVSQSHVTVLRHHVAPRGPIVFTYEGGDESTREHHP